MFIDEFRANFSFRGVRMKQLTAIIQHEGNWFVALCPELDVVSQGRTVEEARGNLVEAVELFLATASSAEIQQRSVTETYVTPILVTMTPGAEAALG